MTVEWRPLAARDLQEIIAYIANENAGAAYRVHTKLVDQTTRLERFPKMGRIGRVPDTRELVITDTPYIAAYRIIGNRVVILRLLHGARRWPSRL